MTKMQRRLEAERKVASYHLRMAGVVTKKNFFAIARTFGLRKALRVLVSGRGTALTVLMA